MKCCFRSKQWSNNWFYIFAICGLGLLVWNTKNNWENVLGQLHSQESQWNDDICLSLTPWYSVIHRAGNSLICSSLIRSFANFTQIKWATVSDLLRLLKTNEWVWANRSGRTEEMSDLEGITQVAQDKWATVSDSLRSLMINDQMSDSLKKCWLKKSFFVERCERITQVAHQKWVMWANRLGHSPKMSNYEWFAQVAQRKWAIVAHQKMREWVNRSFAHFWAKNEQLAQKTHEQIPSPGNTARKKILRPP